ncbi:hypothetical protein GCM10011511_04460 [Puia dinghuensis]|uniref:Uncharacterized protein n=2 Tax=Puia dinghuensis TaxID=1792502 RepID=A0A8J2U7Z4_9BACT|nr:hypothetical protein GCM10011511_04460 [Puia dinghuensis]
MTTPPYGVDKVAELMTKMKTVDDTAAGGDASITALNDTAYASLTLREKFTYHMLNQEEFSQMCDILPERKEEGKRIYGFLPNVFGEYDWSDRQAAFFKDNRDSVETMMKEMIAKDGYVGANLRAAIVMMNGKEMIPTIIDVYKRGYKDHYLLTVLMLLMESNKYPEFMNSTSYKKLYGDETGGYSKYLVYNQANEDLIFQRATNFYNGLSAK